MKKNLLMFLLLFVIVNGIMITSVFAHSEDRGISSSLWTIAPYDGSEITKDSTKFYYRLDLNYDAMLAYKSYNSFYGPFFAHSQNAVEPRDMTSNVLLYVDKMGDSFTVGSNGFSSGDVITINDGEILYENNPDYFFSRISGDSLVSTWQAKNFDDTAPQRAVDFFVIKSDYEIIKDGHYHNDGHNGSGYDRSAFLDGDIQGGASWEFKDFSNAFNWITDINGISMMNVKDILWEVKTEIGGIKILLNEYDVYNAGFMTPKLHNDKILDSAMNAHLQDATMNTFKVYLYPTVDDYYNNTNATALKYDFYYDSTYSSDGVESETDLGLNVSISPSGEVTAYEFPISGLITGGQRFKVYLNGRFLNEEWINYADGETTVRRQLASAEQVKQWLSMGQENTITVRLYESYASDSKYNVFTQTFTHVFGTGDFVDTDGDGTISDEEIDAQVKEYLDERAREKIPQPPSNGWDIVGWFKYFFEWFIYLVEGTVNMLSDVADALMELFEEFNGFTKMLGSFFSFLPTQIVTILMIGMSLGVIGGILRR